MTDQERINSFPIFNHFIPNQSPSDVRTVYDHFYRLAAAMVDETKEDPPHNWEEKNTGLRKLLEARDCFCRAGQKDVSVIPPPAPSIMTDQSPAMIFYKILMANELGNDPSLILKFSDPDGVRTGKSGYSFGVSQFDLKNNKTAAQCLKECGLTDSEIKELIEQTTISDENMTYYTNMLVGNADIVARYDRENIQNTLNYVGELCNPFKSIRLQNLETLFHLADYHNQFGLAVDGKMHTFLKSKNEVITPEDILDFKLHQTLWGQKRSNDVRRRYANIQSICRDQA